MFVMFERKQLPSAFCEKLSTVACLHTTASTTVVHSIHVITVKVLAQADKQTNISGLQNFDKGLD